MADSEGVAQARDKFHCPACGAESNWNPAKQALICPFCGTQSPATLQTLGAKTVIVEHDLVAALRNIPDEARGWKTEKTSVRCQSCQAISVFDPEKIGRNCDFCGSAALVPYAEVKDAFSPESLLPLKISESQARDRIRACLVLHSSGGDQYSASRLLPAHHEPDVATSVDTGAIWGPAPLPRPRGGGVRCGSAS